MNTLDRLVMHIRLDDFHASVEQLLIPALRRRAVVIGKESVASCSREARQLGMEIGMKTLRVARRFPGAVVLHGHRDACAAMAAAAWECAGHYAMALESYGAEAYGDATGMEYVHGSPAALGRKLQQEITAAIRLPVTIGLGSNRLIAWLAGQRVGYGRVGWIRPYEEARLLQNVPVAALPGLSPKSLQALHDMNIDCLGQVQDFSRDQLRALCGNDGDLLYERCRGLDRHTIDAAQLPESVYRSVSLAHPRSDLPALRADLQGLVEQAMQGLRKLQLRVGRCEVGIVYDDGRRANRRKKLPVPSGADCLVQEQADALLEALMSRRVAVRRLHLIVDQLTTGEGIHDLFATAEPLAAPRMSTTIDRIRHRYGQAAIVTGSRLEMLQPRQTTTGGTAR